MAWRYNLPKCPVSPADRGEDMKPKIVDEILAADKAPPEAAFDNAADMLAYLNDTPSSISTPARDDMILIPKAALDWLFGQGPDEKGWHFGDCREAQKAMNTKNPRRYWWRSKFRKMCNYPADTRLKIED